MHQSQHMASSTKSFEGLLQLIQTTNDKYKKYLASSGDKEQASTTKKDINKEISTCQKEYAKIISTSVGIASNNNNVLSLRFNMNDIKQIIENKFVKIGTTKYNTQPITKFANVKFWTPYSVCQFDLKYTKLGNESTIDCDNKHIKIGSSKDNWGYGMILPDKQNVQGYSSGKHCFRMYYKNPKGPHHWLFFGIYKYGIVPKNAYIYRHETSWGIVDNTIGLIVCNGKAKYDKSNMSFLYSLNENQIDMCVDFDKGILSYSIVDDKKNDRKYTFAQKFNTNIGYTVNIGFLCAGTEVQIGKINVDMFGKNKKLVQWPIEKY